jgi:parallel beta-helix repeat protein
MKKHTLISLLLLLAVLHCNDNIIGQSSSQTEFPIGTFLRLEKHDPVGYDSLHSLGLNTVVQYGDTTTLGWLSNYNVIADNGELNDVINHYAMGYYTKWEAEKDQEETTRTGIVHEDGQDTTWQGKQCWSSIGASAPACSLIYGPHYRQNKNYRHAYYQDPLIRINYTARFNMALYYDQQQYNPEDEVCEIRISYRYVKIDPNGIDSVLNTVLASRIITAAEFPQNYSFKDFDLGYFYPDKFTDNPLEDKIQLPAADSITYKDIFGENGIEFQVDWLGFGTLYVDYIEVYDDDVWKNFIDFPNATATLIKNYALNYPPSQWPNLKYWYACDEPHVLDSFTPMHIVDSLIRSVEIGAPAMITEFYPPWQITINGDTLMKQYYQMMKPQKLMLDIYPIGPDLDPPLEIRLESLRKQFTIAHSLQPGFWYVAQAFGWQLLDDSWCLWKKPTPAECSALVMLALVHGSKGIMTWVYATRHYENRTRCGGEWYERGLVDSNLNPTELWDLFHDNIIPRLKGKLGRTLLSLDYTGNYFNLAYHQGENPLPDRIWRYFRWQHFGNDYHWHIGFMQQNSFTDNEYFMLANQRVDGNRTVNFEVQNITDFENVTMRNVEGGVGEIDTTIAISSTIEFLDEFPAGEGKLFQVAPVVKYGGRLIYDEYAGEGQTLKDDMIIENGATLTVYGNYTAQANIIVKDGSIINGENGEIHFEDGMKLIINGTATINGTSANILTLDFVVPTNGNGIVIEPGGSLSISHCEVKNAVKGINSELNANYLYAQYVDFVNCISSSVTILGQMGGGETLPPQVKYCTMSNSEYGISVSNLSQITIQGNTITNTDLGIFLSNVTTPAVIGNTITGTRELAGIFLESCGGIVRSNWISGHTNGIHLGNSSPDVGGNTIEHNWNRGLYVGTGSLPNMQGRLVQDPIHPNLFYAVSGYNIIKENGGWSPDDDGSEIFINDANVILVKGCNQITDPRIPNAGEAPPLYNTQLLMNCSGSQQLIEVHSEGNFWGEHPIYPLEERFGACIVYLDPILNEPCPVPDGSGGKLFITSSVGEIIDTLYAEERTIGTLSATEQLYASAEEKFLTGDLTVASQIYGSIINSNALEEEKYLAHTRKYEIGKLTNQSPEFFNEMGNTFTTLAANSQDSLNEKIFVQLSTLCKVGEEEYETSISDFDAVVQQNPNTEEAVYAEIDALTTALLIEGNDSTLNKGSLAKYLVKTPGDYFSKIDGILRKNFGSEKEAKEKEILPEEYKLYQNYPNPFNPVTTIKYDLPKAGEVELVVYDILGRKVKELVNQTQQAGRYDIQFNASSLASGVYLYQLRTKEFVNSKKMILLK